MAGSKIPDPIGRFWAKVHKGTEDECWPWTGKGRNGRAEFRPGAGEGGRTVDAGRYAYELLRGPIPSGMLVLRRCRHRQCVNPRHLFLGTKAEATGRKVDPVLRFWSKVNRGGADDCWPWTGAATPLGYGHLRIESRNVIAHRFSWTIHNGPIPEGLCVLHRCDRPGCVNPAHLFLGTLSDNAVDRESKDRGNQPVGEASRLARTNDDAVREIRRLRAEGVILRELARRFGLSKTMIRFILTGRKWKHVE